MDAATVTIIVGIGGLVLAILTYIAGTKKSGEQRAKFEGIVEAKLDRLSDDIKDLKKSLSDKTSDLYDEISRQIREHEKRFHNG